jgi:hypothetical protein
MESALADLNTQGLSKSQDIKSQLAAVAVKEAENYEAIKGRRTNFLIIADFIAVIMGLIAIATQATFRAAVGRESVLEERTLEGILTAALNRYQSQALAWLEKLLQVDINGDGIIGKRKQETGVSVVEETGNSSGNRSGNSFGVPAVPPNLQPISGGAVSVVPQGSQRVLVDVSLLKKATRKQWERAFTSKETAAKEENRRKAMQGQKELEKLGYTVTRWVDTLPDGSQIGRMKIEIGEGEEVN